MRQQKNSIILNISYHQCYNDLWKSSFASCSFRFHKNQTFPVVSSLNFFDRPVRCPISVQSSKRLGESAKIGNAECCLGFSSHKSFFPRMVISNHISLFCRTTSQTSQRLLRILHVYEIYSNWNWLYWVSWWEIEIWFCMFVILQMQKPVGFVLK